jgi:branched-chain amino acid transport system permease protein
MVLLAIYATLTLSVDLLVGHMGLVSVCHAALFGAGAYTSALLVIHMGCPFAIALVGAMILAAILSIPVSLAALRLRGDGFVIASFGFQTILWSIFNNWTDLTRGPLGIPGIPPPRIWGWSIVSTQGTLLLAGVLVTIAYFVVARLSAGPFGRVLRAIREDESVAQATGKDTSRFKVETFAVAGSLAAAAGSLYAHYVTFIDPTSFSVTESILILSMVIIGGAGSPWGPVLGAAMLVGLPEALRFLGLPTAVAANMRQILYGAMLVAMMLVRPRGILGSYGFGR